MVRYIRDDERIARAIGKTRMSQTDAQRFSGTQRRRTADVADDALDKVIDLEDSILDGETEAALVPAAPAQPTIVSNDGAFTQVGAVATIVVSVPPVTESVDGELVEVTEYELILNTIPQARFGSNQLTFTLGSGVVRDVRVRAMSAHGVWGDLSVPLSVTGASPVVAVRAPSAPTLATGAGNVFARWDGMYVSGGTSGAHRIDVEARIGAGAWEVQGTLIGAGEQIIVLGAIGDAVMVRLVAYDQLGRLTGTSETQTITISGIDIADLDQSIQDEFDAIDAKATAAQTAAGTAQETADTARSEATSKAAAAQAAAEAHAEAEAEAARLAAIAASSTDATSKANAAQAAAVAAAAADASSKAAAAQAAAEAVAATAQSRADAAFDNAAAAAIAAGNAQTTANGKNRVWYQSTQPAGSGHKVDDVWFNTAQGNRMARWTGSAWVVVEFGGAALANLAVTAIKLADDAVTSAKIAAGAVDNDALATAVKGAITTAQSTAEAAQTAAGNAQSAANTALSDASDAQDAADQAAADALAAAGIANAKGKVIIQSSAPAAADRQVQNLWIDTTGGTNTPKRWVSGSTWAAVTDKAATDAAAAAATADGKAVTAQNAASAASTAAATADGKAVAAQATANAKGKAIIQNAEPATADRLAQNLWIDTTGGANTPKRWSGSAWVAVTDKAATDAAAAAVVAKNAADAAQATANTAQSIANAANTAAGAAQDAADAAALAAAAAQSTANGRAVVVRSTSAATAASSYKQGDQWWQFSGSNIIGLWLHTGSAWQAQALTNTIIATLDAGKINTGFLAAARIQAATITGTHIAGATITAANMVAGTITAASGIIANAAIGTAQIIDLAVSGAKLENATITNAKIANATIEHAKIASVDAAKITTGELAAARIAAKSITADKLLVTGSEELVPDPWFSGSLATISGGTLLEAQATEVPQTGIPTQALNVVRVNGRDNIPFGPNSVIAEAKPGDRFRFEMWAVAAPTTSRPIQHYIYRRTSPIVVGNRSAIAGLGTHNPSTTWTKIVSEYTIPDGSSFAGYPYMQPFIQINNAIGVTPPNEMIWYVTGWSVKRMVPGKLIVDGAVQARHVEMETGFFDKLFGNTASIGRVRVDHLAPNVGDTLNIGGNAVAINLNSRVDGALVDLEQVRQDAEAAQSSADAAGAAADAASQAVATLAAGRVLTAEAALAALSGKIDTYENSFLFLPDGLHIRESTSAQAEMVLTSAGARLVADGVPVSEWNQGQMIVPQIVARSGQIANHIIDSSIAGHTTWRAIS